jgi:hypothetical protein
MRCGTESLNMKWKHINLYTDVHTDKKYLRIWVSGKTGARYLIAKHNVREALERLIGREKLFNGQSLEVVLNDKQKKARKEREKEKSALKKLEEESSVAAVAAAQLEADLALVCAASQGYALRAALPPPPRTLAHDQALAAAHPVSPLPLYLSRATLVVVHDNILFQWVQEARKWHPELHIYIYCGVAAALAGGGEGARAQCSDRRQTRARAKARERTRQGARAHAPRRDGARRRTCPPQCPSAPPCRPAPRQTWPSASG